MNRNPGPNPITELLRLVAVYMAVVLALQGLAAAWALGSGPLHRHRETPASGATLLTHAEQQHRHWHDSGQRHHHAAADASVLPSSGEEELDTLAFALTAALALMALGLATRWPQRGRAVWQAATAWAWRTFLPHLFFKPPRPRC